MIRPGNFQLRASSVATNSRHHLFGWYRVTPLMFDPRKVVCLMTVAMTVLGFGQGDRAAVAGHARWATGAALQQRLAEPVDILWSGNPLRKAIEGLAKSQQVALLIDRRLDPDQKSDVTLNRVPLETALGAIAGQYGFGVARLADVLYVGPPSAANRLGSIADAFQQAVRQLPTKAQQRFFQAADVVWPDLATPRELLSQLGQQGGVEIAGLDQIPHDLWAAADLPPMSLIDRLTLIAVQFDLTFKVVSDGARLELTPITENLPPSQRSHGERSASSPAKPAAPPNAAIERVRIARLSVKTQPLGRVLHQLAERLALEMRIDEQAISAAGISLDQPVSINVEDVSIDELLRKLLQPVGLAFRRQQKVIEVFPAKIDARNAKPRRP